MRPNLTASQQAKAAGLKSLLQVQQLTRQSAQTLINWHRDKPDLFRVVIAGCVSLTEAAKADFEILERLKWQK